MRFLKMARSTSTSAILVILLSSVGSPAAAGVYQDAFNDRLANPGDTNSLSNFINIAADAGQYDQALSTVEQHLITYPRDAEARLISGRLYFNVGSFELAKRQVQYALAIGTLGSNKQAEAQELLQRIEKGLSGISGYISLTMGADIVFSDYAPAAAVSDRTDFNPYGEFNAVYRRSLQTPTDDAIIFSARARIARRFGDFNLSGAGGIFTAGSGRVAIAWDKGLPDSGISSLRLNLSAYAEYSGIQQNAAIREYGILAKFTTRPSVDSTLFANFGYANLSTSDLLFTDTRWSVEAGGAYRISGKRAIGAKIKGQFDTTNGGVFVGQSVEASLNYASLIWSASDGRAWTQRLSLGGGRVKIPDLSATPGTVFDGTFWSASWDQAYEFNDQNRIDLSTYYRKFDLDDASRNQNIFGVGLSYTYTFR